MTTITHNGSTYTWDEDKQSFFGIETSCGSYGAMLKSGEWLPAWWPCDTLEIDVCRESFPNCEQAIIRAHEFFT